ncbi:hypothetical protein EWB00_001731 [Schistosoma japonicum]|uniref:Uncharacterized protein n=1 Tax=Schistosoma japonicum TaxID=6182 RepID=A0A4Z2DEL0_SCHJA|nr:hypothetical protein EWB00_001731 [Schistosoma japonicum]
MRIICQSVDGVDEDEWGLCVLDEKVLWSVCQLVKEKFVVGDMSGDEDELCVVERVEFGGGCDALICESEFSVVIKMNEWMRKNSVVDCGMELEMGMDAICEYKLSLGCSNVVVRCSNRSDERIICQSVDVWMKMNGDCVYWMRRCCGQFVSWSRKICTEFVVGDMSGDEDELCVVERVEFGGGCDALICESEFSVVIKMNEWMRKNSVVDCGMELEMGMDAICEYKLSLGCSNVVVRCSNRSDERIICQSVDVWMKMNGDCVYWMRRCCGQFVSWSRKICTEFVVGDMSGDEDELCVVERVEFGGGCDALICESEFSVVIKMNEWMRKNSVVDCGMELEMGMDAICEYKLSLGCSNVVVRCSSM